MAAKKQIYVWGLAAFIVVLSFTMCAADEIYFTNKSAKQIGTVVEESEQGITVIFPKESIKSITKTKEGPRPSSANVIMEDNGAYITVKIPRQRFEAAAPPAEVRIAAQPPPAEQSPPQTTSSTDSQLREKVERLEKKLDQMEKTGATAPPTGGATQQALLQEEMGSVEGTILWNGKPLKDAKVKIVMENYTGFSMAALKKAFSNVSDTKSSSSVQVALDTQTDSQGHYSFQQVPPGSYTLFWQPDPKTGWVRRIRENPDFEIVPGKLTILNIPEKKKQL